MPYEENERVLDRLRRNDPALKELTLNSRYGLEVPWPESKEENQQDPILEALEAIATNTSLEILKMNNEGGFLYRDAKELARSALSLNTSLKNICIATYTLGIALDIAMACPNLEALSIRTITFYRIPSIEAIEAMAQALRAHTKLLSLTIEEFNMDFDRGAVLAGAFRENQTINTLIMRRRAISPTGAVSFVKSLPHDHCLKAISFNFCGIDDDSAVTIVRTLCHTPLKVLSLVDNDISQDGYESIVQTLQENEHSLTKLELFNDSQNYLWQNAIRLEIDKLTWENQLQAERDAWVDRFLDQDAHCEELVCFALARANRVDSDRFSHAPNMLYYLIKAIILSTGGLIPLRKPFDTEDIKTQGHITNNYN
jgi:hypothetical protein